MITTETTETKAPDLKLAAPPEETKKEAKKFELDVQEYILNGYISYEFKKKLYSYKLRTLTQEEAISILDKAANASMSSKAHAEALLTAYSAGAAILELNGEKITDRKDFKDTSDYLDARFKFANGLGVIMLDVINADFAWLNVNVQEALGEPAEQLKN